MPASQTHQKLFQQKLKEGQKFLFSKPPDYSRAERVFLELTRLAPNWSEGSLWLGLALLDQSRLTEADTAFRRSIALAPTDSRAHLWLGTALERAGRLNDSVQCFRDGLDLKPHYSEADSRVELASVLKKLGRIEEAIAEWQMVARMDASYPSYDAPIDDAKRELKKLGRAI